MNSQRNQPTRGFTLLEMMLVVCIMAVLAATVVAVYQDVGEQANEQIVITEMQELKKAILKFQQDTGSLPKQGPFDLTSVLTGDDLVRFHSPANFSQLFENPVPAQAWDPARGRGWRGPYLSESPVFVDVESATNVRTVCDPFDYPPTASGEFRSRRRPSSDLSYVAADDEFERSGRPYLVLDLANRNTARIVCLGANGEYEGELGDDLVLYLFR